MDLNPWNFEAEESKCELATFCKEADVDGLIVTMAWLRSRAAAADNDDGLSVINYWAMRLRPLLSVGIPTPESAAQPASRPRFFIAANRSGTEQGELGYAVGPSFVLLTRRRLLPFSPPSLPSPLLASASSPFSSSRALSNLPRGGVQAWHSRVPLVHFRLTRSKGPFSLAVCEKQRAC